MGKKTEKRLIKIEGTLREIAENLVKDSPHKAKKIQLIYAFNGTGKTRLSCEVKDLIATKNNINEHHDSRNEILYYNAFTEDLFYWDNNLNNDTDFTLKIQPNTFINWILKDEGKDQHVTELFQHYTHSNILPQFNENYDNINFKLQNSISIKISKGEESNFIWSIFYTLIEQVIDQRNTERENRSTHDFDNLQYIFIDDPVSSLDENHLIQLAIDLAQLIRSSLSGIKFIITTHNALFYNILYSELKPETGNILKRKENNEFELDTKQGSSNNCFSYHIFLIDLLQNAIEQKKIQKYHFTLLRNLYEKTASFLGYQKWSDLLPDEGGVKKAYYSRIMNFSSHSTLSNEIISEPTESEKQIVNYLLKNLLGRFNFSPTLSSQKDE